MTEATSYHPLYTYLQRRFADRVVMTFAEIEDVLGFALPDAARGTSQWWDQTESGVEPSAQSDSWTRAGRTATVNLPAAHVLFERS